MVLYSLWPQADKNSHLGEKAHEDILLRLAVVLTIICYTETHNTKWIYYTSSARYPIYKTIYTYVSSPNAHI